MIAIAAVILAAGQGTRFQAAARRPDSKLLAQVEGQPLVRHVAAAAARSRAAPVIVVTGYRGDAVRAALGGLPLRFVDNPDFAAGLSTSLKAGIAAVPAACRGAVVLLADMPGVASGTIDALVARADEVPAADAVVPVRGGRRGNPVLLGRILFAAVAQLNGDEGARRLLTRPGVAVEEVEEPSRSILADVDTPADLVRLTSADR